MLSLVQSALLSKLEQLSLDGLIGSDIFLPTAFGVALPTTGAGDTIVIDGDAAFLLYYMTGNVSQPAGTNIAAPDILVEIQNAGSGRYFSREPMHWNSIIGTAQRPFIMPEPKLLMPSSNIGITLTNLSGGSYARVDLTWCGSKIYGRNGFDVSNLMGDGIVTDFQYTR